MTVEFDTAIHTMGLFTYTFSPADGVCNTYTHALAVNPSDKNFKLTSLTQFGQAAGIIASLLGFTALVLLLLSFFLRCLLTRVTFRIVLPILLAVAGIFQLCTFASAEQMCRCPPSYVNNCPVVTCNPGDGGNRSIAAAVLYLFIGVLLIFYPRRSVPLFDIGARKAKRQGDDAHARRPEHFTDVQDRGHERVTDIDDRGHERATDIHDRRQQNFTDVYDQEQFDDVEVQEQRSPRREHTHEPATLPRGRPVSGKAHLPQARVASPRQDMDIQV